MSELSDDMKRALAALPPEAFMEGPPEDAELLWRRTLRRMRVEQGLETEPARPPGHLAPVVKLPVTRPADDRQAGSILPR